MVCGVWGYFPSEYFFLEFFFMRKCRYYKAFDGNFPLWTYGEVNPNKSVLCKQAFALDDNNGLQNVPTFYSPFNNFSYYLIFKGLRCVSVIVSPSDTLCSSGFFRVLHCNFSTFSYFHRYLKGGLR